MIEQDESILRELAAHCKDAKEKVRLLALHAISKSYTVDAVADIFCVDDSTIRDWINKWLTERSVSDQERSGRPSVLSNKDKTTIAKLIEENNPKKHGVNAGLWDTKELQLYFAMHGQVVSRDALRVALRNMGAHYVKAILTYNEANLQKQREFAKQFFENLEGKPTNVVVLFEDEASIACLPRKSYGWTLAKRLVVKVSQSKGRKRLNLFGAVAPEQGEVVQMASKESKSSTFIRFLKKIQQKYVGKTIWLYLDNWRVHHSQRVQCFLEKHSSIELRFLPPYSPELNPQEQWWNFLRKKFLVSQCFSSQHSLALSVNGFTRLTSPETVQSVCTVEPLANLLH